MFCLPRKQKEEEEEDEQRGNREETKRTEIKQKRLRTTQLTPILMLFSLSIYLSLFRLILEFLILIGSIVWY